VLLALGDQAVSVTTPNCFRNGKVKLHNCSRQAKHRQHYPKQFLTTGAGQQASATCSPLRGATSYIIQRARTRMKNRRLPFITLELLDMQL
jgi:hypothetical protein